MTTPATFTDIIDAEMSNGANIDEMEKEEWFEFMDYCIAAACGQEAFYLPEETAPFAIEGESG